LSKLREHLQNNPNKLIAQSYDGASVMSGRINGVQAIIRRQYPYAYFLHCYAHQLNLVVERAASENYDVRVFFANLSGIPHFFSHSAKRSQVLDAEVQARLPRGVPSRWNYNSRTVNIVFEKREDLINCMKSIKQLKNIDSIALREADGIIRTLEDPSFMYWLTVFHQIMPHVEILFKQLQRVNTDAIQVDGHLKHFREQIQKVRDEVDQEDVDAGESSCKRRREENRNVAAKEVCDTILVQTLDRFQFLNHLVAAKLLDCDMFPSYQNTFP